MKKITQVLLTMVLVGGLFLSGCDRGEDYKQENEDGEATASSAEGEYDEEEAMYPEEKIQENTNLDGRNPLASNSEFDTIEKRKLIATLLRQKNDLQNRIREMNTQPLNGVPLADAAGDLDQMKNYVERLDQEITKVRLTSNENLAQVEESAIGTIEGAGALLQTTYMRIDRGF